jgi:hypothetical protein
MAHNVEVEAVLFGVHRDDGDDAFGALPSEINHGGKHCRKRGKGCVDID